MTMIRVDPNEMVAVAGVVRSVAGEVAEIGAQIPNSGSCVMPPAMAATLSQIVSGVDGVLDSVAQQLAVEANGLLQRGRVAASGLLGVAAGVAPGLGTNVQFSPVTSGGTSSGFVIDFSRAAEPSIVTFGAPPVGGGTVGSGFRIDTTQADPRNVVVLPEPPPIRITVMQPILAPQPAPGIGVVSPGGRAANAKATGLLLELWEHESDLEHGYGGRFGDDDGDLQLNESDIAPDDFGVQTADDLG